MKSTIVSVRIPESLSKELRGKLTDDHFLDLSEAVRSIVRKRWMEWKDPGMFQIKQLRQDIKDAVLDKTKKSKEEEVLHELERIKELILKEEK